MPRPKLIAGAAALVVAAISTGTASERYSLSSLETDCFLGQDCSVKAFARLDGPGRYYYGLYRVPPDPNAPAYLHALWQAIERTEASNALVLFEAAEGKPEAAVVRVWQTSLRDESMLTYSAPVWIDTAMGNVLKVAGRDTGSGMSQWFNSQYLLRRDAELTVLDTTSWVPSVIEALPHGYEFGGIIRMDWTALRSTVPVWRQGDALCCPTGGKATLYFRWNDATLVFDRLVHSPDADPAEAW